MKPAEIAYQAFQIAAKAGKMVQTTEAFLRATLVMTVKNEGAFLLDWLAHHEAVGFTDFLIFSNDCLDGTDLLLDRLQEMGRVTHVRNPGPHPEGPQWAALKMADKHPLVKSADWILFADIDEFVNIHIGQRQLKDLFAALPKADAITLTWRLFGNDGVIDYEDRPVTEIFTKAAPAILGWPWRAQHFKTLFRNNGTYRKLGVHRPKNLREGAAPYWFDGSGRLLPLIYTTSRVFSDYSQSNYDMVQLNHYPLGAMESYLVKADRGRANRASSALEMSYWVERNFNEVEDRSILLLHSRTAREDLRADPLLGPLHQSAVHWRRRRFAELMQEETWRALFGRLMMTPGSQSLSPKDAMRILIHLPRPK